MNQHLLTQDQSTDGPLRKELRRLPEDKIPDCLEFGSKPPHQAYSELCKCLRNSRAEQENIFIDRRRPSKAQDNVADAKGWFIPKSMLARAIVLMFLMAGYLGAYLVYGLVGLVLFALLVLLALGHPFWLMGFEAQKTKNLR